MQNWHPDRLFELFFLRQSLEKRLLGRPALPDKHEQDTKRRLSGVLAEQRRADMDLAHLKRLRGAMWWEANQATEDVVLLPLEKSKSTRT
jgi:hypothetical protein